MNEMQIFNSEEFGQVRTVTIDNEPWFAGYDVADALGYKNQSDAIAKHVEEEDKQNVLKSQIATLAEIPNRGLTFINESGLYALIFGSKLESAKRFKHWVTSEVLPAIRKSGSYEMPKKKSAEERFRIMEMNARSRMAQTYMKLAQVDTLSSTYKNVLVSKASEVLAGERIIPLPEIEQRKAYSAAEIGNMFGISANKVGRIAA